MDTERPEFAEAVKGWPHRVKRILRPLGIVGWESFAALTSIDALKVKGFSRKSLDWLRAELNRLSVPHLLKTEAELLAEALDALRTATEQSIASRPQPRPFLPRQGVYFIRCGPYVKVGISDDVVFRHKSLIKLIPADLEPLGFIPMPDRAALLKRERELHDQFTAHRYRGEWFTMNAEIARAMSEEAKPWPTKDVKGGPV